MVSTALVYIHCTLIDITVSSIAPSNVPQSLTVVALSPTSLNVSWQPVPAIDRNGIITQYTVEFDPVQTFGGQLTNVSMVVNASESYVILERLQEYVEYDVRVRASTVAGDGPDSPTVQERTLEDGEIAPASLVMYLCTTVVENSCFPVVDIDFIFLHTVPASPPDNVNAINISSTSIRVTWEEVPTIDQNGMITKYEVEYNQTTFSGATMSGTTTVDSSTLMVNLTGLEEYVEYSIRVRAYTSVGAGPYSEVVMERTQQDG